MSASECLGCAEGRNLGGVIPATSFEPSAGWISPGDPGLINGAALLLTPTGGELWGECWGED